jgi:alpha-mannosidase
VLDHDVKDAYFDLKCAYDMVMTPQAGNEVRAFLFDELKKAISLIDPSTTLRAGFEGDGEKFRASLMKARSYVRENIYNSDRFKHDGRLNMVGHSHDILPGSHVTQAFHDAVKDYETVFEKGNQALASALSYIGSQISSDSAAVVVFNMQPWERTDVVVAEFQEAPESSFKIVDANGKDVPFQVLDQNHGQVRVLIEARNVPPMGYAVYGLVEGKPDGSTPFAVRDDSIENDFFQVRFDGHGTISGIYDKKNDRQVTKEGNRFQLFEDVPGRYAAWDIVPMYKDREFELPPVERSEIVESGPVRLVLRQERSLMKSKIVQNIILYRSLPRIDFETEIEWGERDRLLKAGFLVNVNAMRATYDMSYGYIERPTHANTSWDAAKFEVCGHQWADLSEGDYGVSLLNDCKYGYDIFGHRMRLTLLRGPQYPDPTADLGHHSFTYGLYPHRGDWRQAETPRRAWELNDPLVAIPLGEGDGNLQSAGSFLSIDRDHVMISALKMADNGDGLILRLYRRGTLPETSLVLKIQERANH